MPSGICTAPHRRLAAERAFSATLAKDMRCFATPPEYSYWLASMTEILQADEAGVTRAAALLRAGALVAFGTETVYGLGADATDAEAVAAIFQAKGRPRFNPLICHYHSADAAFHDVVADERARRVALAFWPGPLTLVLPRQPDSSVVLLASAGLDTLGVRVPDHPVAATLLQRAARPIAAPSANRSGQVSPTSARHVLDGLDGRIAAVLDSGPCLVGVESSVLDLSGPAPILLRPGGVSVEDLEVCLGPIQRGLPHAEGGASQPLRSPGLAVSHYAPDLPVRLSAERVAADEALLAFGRPLPGARCQFQLSSSYNTVEAAARLFEGLRWLDAEGVRLGIARIAVMPVPEAGLGEAINDRLRRAAAPRSVLRNLSEC
jgi:L-threonylcarbamoyladenylate synthase